MDQSTAPPATGHKTYVFVDEYNRHKRLKVMRACDGCRKRKIRCDGALQNGPWPCGACQRLKLKCIPPTLDQDDDQQALDGMSMSTQFSFQNSTPSIARKSNGVFPQHSAIHEWSAANSAGNVSPGHQDIDAAVYSSQMFSQQLGPRLDPGYSDDEYFASTTTPAQFQSNRTGAPSLFRTQTEASSSPGGEPQEVDAAVKELSEQMGDLSIELTALAPYIANEKKKLGETPAAEDYDVVLPASVDTDTMVRIPKEMMLSDERALDYFGYFFEYVHPYVPVLNRKKFYDQWRNARHTISTLLLEGIFACVAQYLEKDQIEVRRWLALASRHEESFKDVPRLSTIQAMIILTKARESVPRRGYYYRSWMAVKYMTTMAFDLGLHEHYDRHLSGDGCDLDRVDCQIHTRVWQTLFVLEILVGAPQGRTDFAIELETVDFSLPAPEMDKFEYVTSRCTTYFAQTIRNIKQTNSLWQALRRKMTDWALDPAFARQNEVINSWPKTLPPDMQIEFPEDDSPPFLGGNHHLAYTHCYHHLVVIMHHRPQLQALLSKGDMKFQKHLDICNEAASLMCRLQEAVRNEFGLHGLQFMQRGVGFTIYCVLTCTMLHLATITSPDPAVNSRARHYFTRHMRILEHCMESASPEIQVQINTLREAFSEDTSQPFQIKRSLGVRSPSVDSNANSSSAGRDSPTEPVQSAQAWQHLQDASAPKAMSASGSFNSAFEHIPGQPPIPYATSTFSMPTQTAYVPPNLHRVTSAPQSGYALEHTVSHESTTPVWDPSGIFTQWNTAFGQAQATPPSHPQAPDPRLQPTSNPMMVPQQSPTVQTSMFGAQQVPSNANPVMPESIPAMPAVTPVMWQNAFTNAYVSGAGHKRHREETMDPYGNYQKRRG